MFEIKLNKIIKHCRKRNDYNVYDFDHVAKKTSRFQMLKK